MTQLEHPETYRYRFLDRVQVKGKAEPISVFELFDGDSVELIALKQKTKTDFEQALLHYYDRNFAEANLGIARVLAQNPTDKAARLYQQRIAQLMAGEVSPEWTGIEALTEK